MWKHATCKSQIHQRSTKSLRFCGGFRFCHPEDGNLFFCRNWNWFCCWFLQEEDEGWKMSASNFLPAIKESSDTYQGLPRPADPVISTTPCPKISGTPVSNAPNSVCSLWISTKYRTLHYLNNIYCHTRYEVRTLPCVLNVTSLWRHCSHYGYVQCIVIDRGIKQQRTRLSLRACVKAKSGHFEHKL